MRVSNDALMASIDFLTNLLKGELLTEMAQPVRGEKPQELAREGLVKDGQALPTAGRGNQPSPGGTTSPGTALSGMPRTIVVTGQTLLNPGALAAKAATPASLPPSGTVLAPALSLPVVATPPAEAPPGTGMTPLPLGTLPEAKLAAAAPGMPPSGVPNPPTAGSATTGTPTLPAVSVTIPVSPGQGMPPSNAPVTQPAPMLPETPAVTKPAFVFSGFPEQGTMPLRETETPATFSGQPSSHARTTPGTPDPSILSPARPILTPEARELLRWLFTRQPQLDRQLSVLSQASDAGKLSGLAEKAQEILAPMTVSPEKLMQQLPVWGKVLHRTLIKMRYLAREVLEEAARLELGAKEQNWLTQFADTVKNLQAQLTLNTVRNEDQTQQHYYFQIPVLMGEQTHTAEIVINQERQQENRRWQPTRTAVSLYVETDRLGPVNVNALLIGKMLDLTFTVASAGTKALVTGALPQLQEVLEALGYQPGRLECHQGEVTLPALEQFSPVFAACQRVNIVI